MKCPKCGNSESFNIDLTAPAARVDFYADDEVSVDIHDTEWSDDSAVECRDCDHAGKAKDFQTAAILTPTSHRGWHTREDTDQ